MSTGSKRDHPKGLAHPLCVERRNKCAGVTTSIRVLQPTSSYSSLSCWVDARVDGQAGQGG